MSAVVGAGVSLETVVLIGVEVTTSISRSVAKIVARCTVGIAVGVLASAGSVSLTAVAAVGASVAFTVLGDAKTTDRAGVEGKIFVILLIFVNALEAGFVGGFIIVVNSVLIDVCEVVVIIGLEIILTVRFVSIINSVLVDIGRAVTIRVSKLADATIALLLLDIILIFIIDLVWLADTFKTGLSSINVAEILLRSRTISSVAILRPRRSLAIAAIARRSGVLRFISLVATSSSNLGSLDVGTIITLLRNVRARSSWTINIRLWASWTLRSSDMGARMFGNLWCVNLGLIDLRRGIGLDVRSLRLLTILGVRLTTIAMLHWGIRILLITSVRTGGGSRSNNESSSEFVEHVCRYI